MTEAQPKKVAKPGCCYIGAPEVFSLSLICEQVARAFGEHVCYLVGSATERADFRDVDVRLIIGDAKWEALFGNSQNGEISLFWSLINTAISEYIERRTGLNIDFQIQSMTTANGPLHKGGRRFPLGMYVGGEEADWHDLEYGAPLKRSAA